MFRKHLIVALLIIVVMGVFATEQRIVAQTFILRMTSDGDTYNCTQQLYMDEEEDKPERSASWLRHIASTESTEWVYLLFHCEGALFGEMLCTQYAATNVATTQYYDLMMYIDPQMRTSSFYIPPPVR